MFTVTQRQMIERPVAVVFEFLAHFENRPRFESAVLQAELSLGSTPGVGSRYREVRRIMGLKTVTVHEITEYQPPTALRFRSVSGPIPLDGEYRLSGESGATAVVFEFSMAPGGLLRLFSPMIEAQTRRDLALYYDTLKRVLEDPG